MEGMVNRSMKTQELIHIHALLLEARAFLEQEGTAPADAFDAYDAQPVRPTHIHRAKETHMRAINLLLDGLRRSVQTPAPPDRTLSP